MKFEFLTRANAGALHTLCTGNQPEFSSANSKREHWFDEMFKRGLRGWIAFQDQAPVGYVEYLPIEAAPYPVVGQNTNFLTCLWVLPHAKHLGIGGSLLAACLGDSPNGVATIAYQGEYKPVEFFAHFGFRKVDSMDDATLLVQGSARVQMEHAYYRAHESTHRLAVDVLYNPECPWSTRTAERVIASIKAHPAFEEMDLWVGDAWECGAHLGLHGGIYLNGVKAFAAPPTETEIHHALENALTIRVPSDI